MDENTVAHRRKTATRRKGVGLGRIVGLLIVLLVACMALVAIWLIPRRTLKPEYGSHVRAGEAVAIKALAPGEKPRARGLGYMVAARNPKAAGSASVRGQLKSVGMLRAYSEPPDRVVFDPAGGAHYLPVPPLPGRPRVPGAVSRGNKNAKKVALTFDDGYSGMGDLVDLLLELRVPATLFPAGAACAADKQATLKAVKYGFEVANHSWNHPMFTRLSDEGIVRELTSADNKLKEITGQGMVAYFRPPYGDCDDRVTRVAGGLGYLVVMWNHDTLDWSAATSPEQLISRATDGVENGAIILMHSHAKYTLEVLPTIVETLREKGFELTTLSGVLAP